MNIGFTKTFEAGAAVLAKRLVKFDGSGDIVQAAAAADLVIGISDRGAAAAADRIDVIMAGQPEVEAGAAFAAGAPITADANGKAVAAGAGEIAIGFAVEAALADGDIVTIHLCRHKA